MKISHYKTIVLIALVALLTIVTVFSQRNIRELENKKNITEEKVTEIESKLIEVEKENKELKSEVEQKSKENDKIQSELNNVNKKLKERKKLPQVSRGSLTLGNRSVPSNNTSMKSYMSYKAITSRNSPQYELQHSGKVHTDSNGFRRVGNMYCVAVGTYYADSIGTVLEIKLENGNTFKAVVGDFKANRHTDSSNRQHTEDKSVIEFIINGGTLTRSVKTSGDCSSLKGMDGNIASIKVIGKVEF